MAGRYAIRAYKLEIKRDDERRQEANRAQAEHVSIYWGRSPTGSTPRREQPERPAGHPSPRLRLDHHKSARFRDPGRSAGQAPVDAGDRAAPPAKHRPRPRVHPTTSPARRAGQEQLRRLVWGGAPDGCRLVSGARFTDASGVRQWDRRPDGALRWLNAPTRPRWVRVRKHRRRGYTRKDGLFARPRAVSGTWRRVGAKRTLRPRLK
jgi:hypothetical protein